LTLLNIWEQKISCDGWTVFWRVQSALLLWSVNIKIDRTFELWSDKDFIVKINNLLLAVSTWYPISITLYRDIFWLLRALLSGQNWQHRHHQSSVKASMAQMAGIVNVQTQKMFYTQSKKLVLDYLNM
jgi:hypothetical protein